MNIREYRASQEWRDQISAMASDMMHMGKVIVPKMFTLPSAPVHYELCKLAMSRTIGKQKRRHTNIRAPRDLAKSSYFAGLLPIWHIFLEDLYYDHEAALEIGHMGDLERYLLRERPPKFIPILSKTQGHSIKRLRSLRYVLGDKKSGEQSKDFLAHFGDWGHKTARKWNEDEIILKDNTIIMALGAGQQGRGLNEDYQRPTLVLGDDQEDENNTRTRDAMDKNYDVWVQGFYNGMAKGGRAYNVGTPLNDYCLLMTLEEQSKKMPGWEARHYKFLNEDENGELYSLWPEKLTVKDLIDERKGFESAGRVYVWYHERQCEVRGREDQIFRKDDFRYCRGYVKTQGRYAYLVITHEGVTADSLAKIEEKIVPVTVTRGVDAAATSGARSDHTAIITRLYAASHIAGRRKDEAHYVFRLHKFKTDDPEVISKHLISDHKSLPASFTGVEQVNFQAWLEKTITKDCFQENVYIPGLSRKITPVDKKSKRYILDMKPITNRGQMWIVVPPEERPDEGIMPAGAEQFVEEAVQFRVGRDGDDDCLDAFWDSLQENYPPNHTADFLEDSKTTTKREEEVDWLVI